MPTAVGTMPMGPASAALVAFEALVAELSAAEHRAWLADRRRAFESRTGAFAPDDPWFDARSRAFADDLIARQRFGERARGAADRRGRAWIDAFGRSERGLFSLTQDGVDEGRFVLTDVWSGAAFVVTEPESGVARGLREGARFVDGYVCATREPAEAALLPGALEHPLEASDAIERVLAEALQRGLAKDATFDALLRMERHYRSLTRMRPTAAYRVDGLPAA
jgi:hypothetical protein